MSTLKKRAAEMACLACATKRKGVLGADTDSSKLSKTTVEVQNDRFRADAGTPKSIKVSVWRRSVTSEGRNGGPRRRVASTRRRHKRLRVERFGSSLEAQAPRLGGTRAVGRKEVAVCGLTLGVELASEL